MPTSEQPALAEWLKKIPVNSVLLDLIDSQKLDEIDTYLLRACRDISSVSEQEIQARAEHFRQKILVPLRGWRKKAQQCGIPDVGSLFFSHASEIHQQLQQRRLTPLSIYEFREAALYFAAEIGVFLAANIVRAARKGGENRATLLITESQSLLTRVVDSLALRGVTIPPRGAWLPKALGALALDRINVSEGWLRKHKGAIVARLASRRSHEA